MSFSNTTEFYRRVRFFAKKNNIPVAKIEEQIGACNGYLRKLRHPDYYTMRKVAKVFNMTTDDFMQAEVGDVQTIKPVTVFETDYTEDEWRLIMRLVMQGERENKK